jgi:hypothetical protein
MIDYTLKFPDEQTAMAVLEPFVQTHSIDVIGIIYQPTGRMLENEVLEMEQIAGWHVNVRGPQIDAFSEYEIVVKNPVRRWA